MNNSNIEENIKKVYEEESNIIEKHFSNGKKFNLVRVNNFLFPSINTYVNKEDVEHWNIFIKQKADKLAQMILSVEDKTKINEVITQFADNFNRYENKTNAKNISYYEFTKTAILKHTLQSNIY